jgi:hypothetical protein
MRKTILFALISVSFAAQAGTGQLLPPSSADLVSLHTSAAALPPGTFEHKPVSFRWTLDPTAELATAAPFVSESREYWTQVEATDLQRGFAIDTSAPGAVVRISPIGKALPAAPEQLHLLKAGAAVKPDSAFAHRANAEQLQQAGMDVSNGSAVVQFNPQLGQGRFQLQMANAQGRYLLHVFEPNSPYALHAQTDHANVLAGDRIEVAASLAKGDAAMAGTQMSGLLVSPSGQSYNLNFVDNGHGGLHAMAQLPAQAGNQPGLWEAQVFAGVSEDGSSIQRDTRTAFAVAQPTARLDGRYQFDPLALRFNLPIQVGASGRYGLSGTLYATAPDGVARPVAVAQSAAWFEPGQRALSLSFDRASLPTGYRAPFELRYVELKDQTRQGQLETRELAVREGRIDRVKSDNLR